MNAAHSNAPSSTAGNTPAAEAPVRELVGRAVGASRAVRAGQALLVAVAAGCSVQVAIVADGGTPFGLEAWVVAGLAACFCGAAWFAGLPVRAAAVAGRIDVQFGRGGALATAFEVEPRGGAVVVALSTRALAELPRGEVLRRAVPDSTFAGAAPLVAAAILALALESRDRPPAGPRVSALTAAMAEDLAQAALAAPGDSPDRPSAELVTALREAASEAADLAERAARRPDDSSGDEERTRKLIGELERLARETPVDAPWRDAVDSARVAAHALGAKGLSEDGEPGVAEGDGDAQAAGPASNGAEPGASELAPLPAGAPSAADARVGATIAGALPPDLSPADAALVSAWLESRRVRD
ncbi:hypothetical protein [Engelhardtia mirabilis]|uniref:Uncharacterized protein n=1 Tax=Engelhardtia mirabilis TaxID=2528011 RepID=A0A518BQK1_9BACT|nr:hypothetical protein Pla133_43560 [Planctomycetes bacterium Pla133]QDV03566.1 hypothetical protein Pla86_43550 [Planctomycetes bacterium Pla86]